MIVIRADASHQIGSGHVMRCLTLAESLRDSGETVEFIARDHSGNMNEYVQSKGFKLHALSSRDEYGSRSDLNGYEQWLSVKQEQDAAETMRILDNMQPDWLIVDHYALDHVWEKRLEIHVGNIAVIDDLCDRRHDCDCLLDMTEGRKIEDYNQYVPDHCQLLLGAKYALLRPQFIEYRAASLEKREKQHPVERILVAMGGSDSADATSWVLQGIEQAGVDVKIDVVIGDKAPHIHKIKEQIGSMSGEVRLLLQVENMAELMMQADLAIGAGGTTSWERCCLGLPAIILVTEDNQRTIAQSLHKLRAAWSMGWFDDVSRDDFINSLLEIIGNRRKRYEITRAASGICDGSGAKRVAEAILQ